MNTTTKASSRNHREERHYALCRGLGCWEVTFEGRPAIFQHELGALYVACLLLDPPREPIHAVALAFKARQRAGQGPAAGEVPPERRLGRDDDAAVRALWRRQRELERILADRLETEPVKAEAQRELEEITEYLRKSRWPSRHGAERSVRAVAAAIKRLHAHLAAAVDAEGKPDELLRAFALHLHEYLLVPSGRGGAHARAQAVPGSAGCFTYEPPAGLVWESEHGRPAGLGNQGEEIDRPRPEIRNPKTEVRRQMGEDGRPASLGNQGEEIDRPRLEIRKPKTEVRRQMGEGGRPEAVGYLARFLCVGLALGLLATGCTGTRPLKGGKAVTTQKPAGVIEQTLAQGENPSQATKQDQETVKVRSYTVPAGSRVEQSPPSAFHDPQYERNGLLSPSLSPSKGERVPKVGEGARQPSTLPPSPSGYGGWATEDGATRFTLSAPMPVVEREETRARTELGAAQKDTARELGAKLSSLKGIVWVGVGLFVFGLASLVWPPLKVVIGSVTTSAALLLGGVALVVLPTLVVGNELLILGGVGLAVGAWFLAHRHGELRGMVAASTPAQTPASNQSSVISHQ
jgi:hypothetical protein